MKYLLILTALAGGYYQFLFPKLTEDSARQFMDALNAAEAQRDFAQMESMFTDTIEYARLNRNLDVVDNQQISRDDLMTMLREVYKPKHDIVSETKIESIDVANGKAMVTAIETVWITMDNMRIKDSSRAITTIIVDGLSLKASGVAAYQLEKDYRALSSN